MQIELFIEPQQKRLKALVLALQGDKQCLQQITDENTAKTLLNKIEELRSNSSEANRLLFGAYSLFCKEALIMQFVAHGQIN